MILYGIPNCDTARRARAWLNAREIAHGFHDYRKDGAEPDRLRAWSKAVGWEALVNRRGTTWRKLAPSEREGLDEAGAIALMSAHPALIRRPVVEYDGDLLIGFDPAHWEEELR